MLRLRTILHPTDFSENSRYALDLACALARDYSARLILLHVLPRAAPIGRDERVPAFKDAHTAQDLDTYRQEMAGRLEKMRQEAFCTGVEPKLQDGDPAKAIVCTAEETLCDLIVMGSQGTSRRRQAALGGVAAEVTDKAPCPVVTVRLPNGVRSAAPELETASAGTAR